MRLVHAPCCAVLLAALIASGAAADVPTVSIAYPPEGALIDVSMTPAVVLEASVADPDEAITSVEFQACAVSCKVGGSPSSCGTSCNYVTAGKTPPYQARWKIPTLGLSPSIEATIVYQLTARVTNVAAQIGTAQSSMTVTQPPIPHLTLVAPKIETGYVTPTSPVLYATAASDTVPASTVDHVDFLDGDSVIGTVVTPNAAPTGYAFVWQNAPAGMHLISARATNTLGYSNVTDQVTVYIVGPDPPPQVTLSSPTTGQIFNPASAVPLSASASSALGTIQRVEFTTADLVIDTVFSPPYTGSWVNPPPGNFAVVARAYDDVGVAAASPAAYVQVLPRPRTPSVVLTAPAPGTTLASGTPLAMAATALAPDGAIGRVDFYADATLLGSAPTEPYQFNWANPSAGAQSLTARAYDVQGNAGRSAPVPVTVTDNRLPAVTLTAPVSGAQFTAPATIALAATASDPDGMVAKVEFFSGATKVATATSSPYNASWSNVGAGSYTLTAVATDNLGGSATSGAVEVTVTAPPPTVSLAAPASGAHYSLGQAIVITAQASAPQRSISRVEFYSDGTLIGSAPITGGLSAINVDLSWTGATPGPHALTAKVSTSDGASATSGVVNVTVSDLAVSLSEPHAGQVYQAPAQIRITANPGDPSGAITQVDFYGDDALLGSRTEAPYSFLWSDVAEGSHTIRAHVVDNTGLTADSATITVSVQPIGLTIVSPIVTEAASAAVSSDFLLVHGTYVGDTNTGITVNGVTVETDGAGNFAINNLGLASGDNRLDMVLTTIDGQTVTRSINVTSGGASPFQIAALPDSGNSPLTVVLTAASRGAERPRGVTITSLGGAVFDASTFDGETLGTISFSKPGLYLPRITLTYGSEQTYTQTIAIVVRDGVAMDRMFIDMFNRFSAALSARNKSDALKYFTEPSRPQYGAALDALDTSLPDVVATFKAFGGISIGGDVAQYALKRFVDGKTKIYLIEFLRDADGVWRLDSW